VNRGISDDASFDPYRFIGSAGIAVKRDHLGFSLVRGRFTDFDAEIDFDPDDPEAAKVSLTIDADSVISFSATRDKAIKGKSLLNVAKHPTITFVSKNVELLDGNDAMVTGDMTLLGVTREESFKTTMRRAGLNELTMRETAGFSVEGETGGCSTRNPLVLCGFWGRFR